MWGGRGTQWSGGNKVRRAEVKRQVLIHGGYRPSLDQCKEGPPLIVSQEVDPRKEGGREVLGFGLPYMTNKFMLPCFLLVKRGGRVIELVPVMEETAGNGNVALTCM